MGDTQERDPLEQLRKLEADLVALAAAHIIKGKFAAEMMETALIAKSEISRLRSELEKARARTAMLQEKLWSVLKERRDDTSFAALTAKQDLDWAISESLNSHLPTLAEVQSAGPYVRAGWGETLEQARERLASSPPVPAPSAPEVPG
jgi:predicted  nucleic acid-binding Zn-ribbon protein